MQIARWLHLLGVIVTAAACSSRMALRPSAVPAASQRLPLLVRRSALHRMGRRGHGRHPGERRLRDDVRAAWDRRTPCGDGGRGVGLTIVYAYIVAVPLRRLPARWRPATGRRRRRDDRGAAAGGVNLALGLAVIAIAYLVRSALH